MHPTTYTHNTTVIANERYTISAHPIPKAPGECPSQKAAHALFKKNGRQ